MAADWLLKPHSGLPLIPNWLFINTKIKADKLWMLFFDCEDPCLPAYVGMRPKSSPARDWAHPYKHTEIWALGKGLWMWWSTVYGRRASQHGTCHIYSGWDLAVLMFTVFRTLLVLKFKALLYLLPFCTHRDVRLGGSFLPPTSLGKAVVHLKWFKNGEIERFIIGVHLRQG